MIDNFLHITYFVLISIGKVHSFKKISPFQNLVLDIVYQDRVVWGAM
jgi:hypothetical protein